MPLIPAPIAPPPEPPRSSSSALVIVVNGDAATGSSAVTYSDGGAWAADGLIEEPIGFVVGLEANPTREQAPEPAGSGPFGF